MGEDTLENQFMMRYETGGASDGEIEGGAKFRGEGSVFWRRKNNEREEEEERLGKGYTRKGGIGVAGKRYLFIGHNNFHRLEAKPMEIT
jgi:hypothetical protein